MERGTMRERKPNARQPRKRSRVNRKNSELESTIQKDVVNALTRMGIVVNRVNSGASQIEGRNLRCNSLNGKSDLEFWLHYENEAGYKIPIAIYAEMKSKTGKQRPSQVEYQKLMEKTGQHYFVARSVADVINYICDLRDDAKENIPGFRLVIGKIRDLKRIDNAK